MKKIIIIAAIAATFVLAASAERVPSQGKVYFESTAMPELNCTTVAMENVQSIYRLIPSNVTDICVKEYAAIRKKAGYKTISPMKVWMSSSWKTEKQ